MFALIPASLLAALSLLAPAPRPANEPASPPTIVARTLFTVADDFIVDIYHNGRPLPDDRRTLLNEIHGATAERIQIDLRPGDWLVFHVVNNRFRWGGASYFAVTARGDNGVAFVSEAESGRWSHCDQPDEVRPFLHSADYLAWQVARPIANPWGEGDRLMSQIADGWTGKPVWGRARSTWIKYRVPSASP
jgi:hypothetical protein